MPNILTDQLSEEEIKKLTPRERAEALARKGKETAGILMNKGKEKAAALIAKRKLDVQPKLDIISSRVTEIRKQMSGIDILGRKAKAEEKEDESGLTVVETPDAHESTTLDLPPLPAVPEEPRSLEAAPNNGLDAVQQETPPLHQNIEKKSFDIDVVPSIVIVRAKGIESFAQHRADDAMEVDNKRYEGFRGFLRSVGDNITRPYRRGKAYNQAKSAMLDNQNIFGDESMRAAHEEEMEFLRGRFMIEGTEVIHQEAEVGEEKEEITNLDDPRRKEVIDLMVAALNHSVTKEQFESDQRTVFQKHGLLIEDSIMTDNMWSMVCAYRNIEDQEQAAAKLREMKLILGTAALGVRTGPHYGMTDKIINKLEKSPLTRWINPTTLAVGVAVAAGVMSATSRAALSTVAPVAGSAAFAGVLGFAQASESFKRDLYNDRRDAAMNQSFSPESKRRQALMNTYAIGANGVSTRFHMLDVHDLTYSLDGISRMPENHTVLTQEDLKARLTAMSQGIDLLAQVRSRVSLSNRMRIDLIRYSSTETVEVERLKLDVSIMRAKQRLQLEFKEIQNNGSSMGLSVGGVTFEELYKEQLESTEAALLKDNIESTHKHATLLRRKHARRAGAIAAGSSLAFAGLTYGVSSAYHWAGDLFKGTAPEIVASSFEVPTSAGNTQLSLLGGESFAPNDAGTAYDLVKDGHIQVAGLSMDTDGTFTPESVTKLEAAGYTVNEAMASSQNIASLGSTAMTPSDYLSEHKEKLVKLSHIDWANNNTIYSDLNELKLDWGGANHSGITSNGDYSFSVAGMTEGGSIMGTESFSPSADGKVYVALSITRDTQDMVFTFPVGSDGQAIIPADSDAAKMLFSEQNGKAVFQGNFAHAMYFDEPPVPGGAEVRGVSLATHIGTGQAADFSMTTTGTTVENIPASISLTPPVAATDAAGKAFAVPFPVFMRKELEKDEKKDRKLYGQSLPPLPPLDPVPELEKERSTQLMADYMPDDGLPPVPPLPPLPPLPEREQSKLVQSIEEDSEDPDAPVEAQSKDEIPQVIEMPGTVPILLPEAKSVSATTKVAEGAEAEKEAFLKEMAETHIISKVHGIAYPAVPLIKLIKKAEELKIPEDQWPSAILSLYKTAKKKLIESINFEVQQTKELDLSEKVLDQFEVARWLGLEEKSFHNKFMMRYRLKSSNIERNSLRDGFGKSDDEACLEIEQMGLSDKYRKDIRNFDEKVKKARNARIQKQRKGGV